MVRNLSTYLRGAPLPIAKRAKGNYYYVVEVKEEPEINAEKNRNPSLLSALGEIVTRVTKMKYCKYAVALPDSFFGIIKRRVPPNAAKRLYLEFLLVDSKGSVRRITWSNLKKPSNNISDSESK